MFQRVFTLAHVFRSRVRMSYSSIGSEMGTSSVSWTCGGEALFFVSRRLFVYPATSHHAPFHHVLPVPFAIPSHPPAAPPSLSLSSLLPSSPPPPLSAVENSGLGAPSSALLSPPNCWAFLEARLGVRGFSKGLPVTRVSISPDGAIIAASHKRLAVFSSRFVRVIVCVCV